MAATGIDIGGHDRGPGWRNAVRRRSGARILRRPSWTVEAIGRRVRLYGSRSDRPSAVRAAFAMMQGVRRRPTPGAAATSHDRPLRRRRRHARQRPAGRAAAPAHHRRGHRAAAPAGAGQAARGRVRRRAGALDDPVGTARRGQDDDRAADGRRLQRRFRRAVGGALGREGDPRRRRPRRDDARAVGPRNDPVRRRGAPLQQEPAGRVPAARRVGAVHLRRRDHREPVVRGELGAAVARRRLRAGAARRR